MASFKNTLNIIVIEDHDTLRQLITQALTEQGFYATGFACAEDLEEQCLGVVDVFVLDLNLPGEDGLSLAARLRQIYPLVGIILVTARTNLADKVAGYRSGADIYMAKPIAVAELCAAVESLGARRQAVAVLPEKSVDPVFTLDQRTMTVWSGGSEKITLSPSETRLLSVWVHAQHQRLDTWQFAEFLGNKNEHYSKGSLEVRMTRLRKKLIQAGAPTHCIEAVRGLGYQLCIRMQLV